MQTLHDDLCLNLIQSSMEEVLNSVDDDFSLEFYDRYLHDFVCSLSLDARNLENSTKVDTLNSCILTLRIKVVL